MVKRETSTSQYGRLWIAAGCPEVMKLHEVSSGKTVYLANGMECLESEFEEKRARIRQKHWKDGVITHAGLTTLNDLEETHTKVAPGVFFECSVCLKRFYGDGKYCGEKCRKKAEKELLRKLVDFD